MKKAQKEQFNPLKNMKKTSESSKSSLTSIQASDPIASSVDEYARIQAEIKHLEGERDSYKKPITDEGKAKYAERMMSGQLGNIKLIGNEHMVTFIAQNSSSQLTESDIQNAEEKFGKKVITDLVTVDLSSLKFNPDFVGNEAVQAKIFASLEKAFKPEELAAMFLPVSSKVVDNVLERATNHVKTAANLVELYDALKIKCYIKV